MKRHIPSFISDEDAEQFIETADLTEYDLSGFKPAKFEFEAKAAQLNMRLPQTLLEAVKAAAKARGIPYTRLVRETLEQVVGEGNLNNNLKSRVFTIGNIKFSTHSDSVLIGEQRISLPSREQAALELLILQKGIVLSKKNFLDYVFGVVEQPDIKIIDFLLARLRKTLIEAGASPVIKTVWGRGYTLQENASDRPKENDRVVQANGAGSRNKLRAAS